MKKFLLSLLSIAAVAFSSGAVEPTTIEFTKGSTAYGKVSAYDKPWKSTDGVWAFKAFNNNNNGWDFIAAGWKSDATNAYFATATPSEAPVSTIVASVGDRYDKAQITKATLYVADNADFTGAATTDVTANLPAAKGSDMTIEVPGAAAGQYVKVEFEIPKQSSNGYVLSLTKIVINYSGVADDRQPAGLAWSASEVEVREDALDSFVAPTLTNPNNLDVAYTSSDENVADVDATGEVTLTGDLGTATITAEFAGNDQFRPATVSYTITVKAAVTTVNSVKETIALADGTEFTVGYALTVGFVNNNNVFVCDAAGDFIQIYGKNSLKAGDVIPAGWTGTYKLFNGATPEIELGSNVLPEATAGTFTPKETAATDITTALVNHVVTIKDVVFAEATPKDKVNFTGKVGETELSFRNNYTKPSVEAGTYDVTVVVSVYNKNVQLYVIEYKAAGDQPVIPDPTELTVKTLAEAFAVESGTEIVVDCPLTVGFVNNNNVFVCDAAGDFIQIYGKNSLKAGDVIPAGWKGTYKLFNGVTPEIELGSNVLPEATAGEFTPKAVPAADVTTALVNHVVTIKDVVFAEATPSTKTNFTGMVGNVELSFRNNYTKPSVEAGTYDVTVVVMIFDNKPSLYVIEYKAAGDEPVIPDPTEVTVKTLAEAFAVESGTEIVVDCPLTVGFVNNNNVFVCDAAGDFIQIYGKNSLKAGDVIPAGWKGTYKLFNGVTPEIELGSNVLPEATAGEFTPKAVPAADVTTALVNHVVTIKNVVFAEATPSTKTNFTGMVGNVELSFRNNYTKPSVEAGTYDVTVVVMIFNNKPSLYVVEYKASASTGIEDITAEEDAEAVYYNLNGVRVENPANGIYLRVCGSKVSKVYVK